MNKKILIDTSDEKNIYVAIVEGDRLINFFIDSDLDYSSVGDVFLGRVDHVEKSLQAYFIDYGAQKNGFLPFSSSKTTLEKNQYVAVQVTKDEKHNKGAMLTTFIEIKTILTIFILFKENLCSLSRKISSKTERSKLKDYYENLSMSNNIKLHTIFREAALSADSSKLKKDFDNLQCKIRDIIRAEGMKDTHLILKSNSVIEKTIIDHYKSDTEVIVQGDVPKQILEYSRKHTGTNIFVDYNVDKQIESIFSNRVNLPSGGYMIIQHTEALTSIDVNSGVCKKGNSIDSVALLTNMEAAKEAAYQIQLRDIGGLIVIDFIDMYHKEHILSVVEEMKKFMDDDKAKNNIGEFNRFGLLSISRQQLRKNTFSSIHEKCRNCQGIGFFIKDSLWASVIMRKLIELSTDKNVEEILIKCSNSLAYYMLNKQKSFLYELECQHKKSVQFEFLDSTPEIAFKKHNIWKKYDDVSHLISDGKFIMPQIAIKTENPCEENVKLIRSLNPENIVNNKVTLPESTVRKIDDSRFYNMVKLENYFKQEPTYLKECIFIDNQLIGQI
ncbi:MAG: ribonuclease E/G [Alphaproteobacteria bacterium]|nr:MAG: ribonuclease E/G [Alphaproteobacteria bacterium]